MGIPHAGRASSMATLHESAERAPCSLVRRSESPMSAPTCEFILAWPTDSKPAVYCGTVATQRYPAMGGGFMHMCDEHSIIHLNHTEPIPMDSPEPILQFFAH